MNNFERIKSTIKLTDVVDQDLNLKRSGKILKGQCPFHDDNTPSFAVYPSEQTFHCFGCGRNGTVIDYFMYRENIKEPYEAVEYVAERYEIMINGFDKETIKRKKDLVTGNRSRALTDYKNAKMAESFLMDRGFIAETTKQFGIGFNVEQNAVTIPFLDTYGNVVGQSYRNFDEHKPKYVNSAESEVFNKSELLYGLDKARKNIDKHVYIVEGYFDVMALHQMGYTSAVAYCGQSLTDGQATLLSKYIKRHTKIFLVPDNDKTGLKHVASNVKLLRQKLSNPIGVIKFPDGIKDANDVLQLGVDIDYFDSEHHEMFLLKQELDSCLEQTDEYEVARNFVKYTKNKMIRSEMADYLAERWNKAKEVVASHMETDSDVINNDKHILTFDDIRDKYIKNAQEGNAGKVFLDWDLVDGFIPGMRRTEVAYLLGRAGSGKTTFILNLIHNVIFNQKKNVIFNSLELDGSNITPQLLQIHFDALEREIKDWVLSGDKRIDYPAKMFNKHLRVVDKGGQSLKDIENFAIMANESHFTNPVGLIVIDYFGYIKREGKRDNYTEFSEIAREMKQMAKRLNCVVFVLTQTNRGGGDGSEPLSMESARDTGAIEESGDYVLGVYRPAAKSDIPEDERLSKQHEYYLQILKNRWGRVGKAELHFEGQSKLIADKGYKTKRTGGD